MKFGLIGKPIKHSYSPRIHELLGISGYELCEVDNLAEFFEKRDFKGINVTIPYKVEAMKFCDELSETARQIGAVNIVVKREDGSLYGDNSDYYGFIRMVENSQVSVTNKECLVLGSGGVSKSVCKALESMGASKITVVSRNGDVNYENMYEYADTGVICNCTPAGSFPHTYELNVNVTRFQRLTGVIDVIYNPARTRLALEADRQQIAYVTGLPMLVYQAAKTDEVFTGNKISEDRIHSVIKQLDFEMRNILLIGMPGCGKSTIGASLSEKLGRELIDLDEEIEKHTGRKCAEIITNDGEAAFRTIETEMLEKFSRLSGKIISCGGGVISPKQNRYIMKQNAFVVWIQRNIDDLVTGGRPISEMIGTHELYRFREPLYIESCDYTFFNDGDINSVTEKIIRGLMDEDFSN